MEAVTTTDAITEAVQSLEMFQQEEDPVALREVKWPQILLSSSHFRPGAP